MRAIGLLSDITSQSEGPRREATGAGLTASLMTTQKFCSTADHTVRWDQGTWWTKCLVLFWCYIYIFLMVSLQMCPDLCAERNMLAWFWREHCISKPFALNRRPEKVGLFSHSYDWSTCPQNFLSYILKLSRSSLWCMTVGVRTVDDSSALLNIVGKYEEQNSPSVLHFLS